VLGVEHTVIESVELEALSRDRVPLWSKAGNGLIQDQEHAS
jgi:hypothetical protein